jgi:3-(methylthio)propionyl---CoA ligase
MKLIGQMMNRPLLVSAILEHGADQFGAQQVVSRETHGPLHSCTFRQLAQRSKQLANALRSLWLETAKRDRLHSLEQLQAP